MIESVRNFISHIASSDQAITLELKGDQIYMSDSYSNNHKLFFYEPLNSILDNDDIMIKYFAKTNKFSFSTIKTNSVNLIGNMEIINDKVSLFFLKEKKLIDATCLLNLLKNESNSLSITSSLSLNNIQYRCNSFTEFVNSAYFSCNLRPVNKRQIKDKRIFKSIAKSIDNDYPLIYIEDENNFSIKLINYYENITLEKSFNFKDDVQNELDNIILTINSFASKFNIKLNQESYIDFNYDEGKILLSPNLKFNIEHQSQKEIFNYLKENINMTNRGLFNSICRSLFNSMDDNSTIDTIEDLYNYKQLQEIVDV